MMKERIESVLLDHLNDGFVKIIFGPKGVGKTDFLFEYFKSKLELLSYNIVEFRNANSDDILNKIFELNNDRTSTKEKNVILLKNIYNFYNFDIIINSALASNNLDLICTSDIEYPSFYIEKATYIRGRVFSIFYPSTTYDDFIEAYGNDVNKYLFNHDLDSQIFENIKMLHFDEANVYKKLLTCFLTPATNRLISKKLHNEISEYEVDKIYKNLKNKFLFYALNRMDIKKNEIVRSGKLIYPIDTRFYYYFDNNNYRRNYKKYLLASVVAKLFYENYKVYKAIFSFQRKNEGIRKFVRNGDAGFLAIKNGFRFLLFVEPNLDDNLIDNIKKVPSNLPKYIVTFDQHGRPEMDENGLFFCSVDYFLLKGIN